MRSFRARLIELEYANAGIPDQWNDKRVQRLCHWLQVCLEDLGALCGYTLEQVDRFHVKDKYPMPMLIHCAILEAAYLEKKIGIRKPVFPAHLLFVKPRVHHD